MKKNVGKFDAFIRFTIVVVLLAMISAILIQSPLGIFLTVLAGVIFTTAITQRCILYNLLGINTRKKSTNSSL